jgi:hypothetical protein
MTTWMKRRIERSRARCHKELLAHRQRERRAAAETKTEQKSKAEGRRQKDER